MEPYSKPKRIDSRQPERPCEQCGRTFVPTHNSAGRFCRTRCAYDFKIAQRPPPPSCAYCGGPIKMVEHPTRTVRKRRFCSLKCKGADEADPRNARPPIPVPGATWIPFPNGIFALVDDIDVERVRAFRWHYHRKRKHVAALIDGHSVMLHHLVLSIVDGHLVDHRDGDALNNRRNNLRKATDAQNAWNALKKRRANSSSRFKGVHRLRSQRGTKHWQAQIRTGGRGRFLGNFALEEDAARAYDAAARKHFGEFACVNFPLPGERSAI